MEVEFKINTKLIKSLVDVELKQDRELGDSLSSIKALLSGFELAVITMVTVAKNTNTPSHFLATTLMKMTNYANDCDKVNSQVVEMLLKASPDDLTRRPTLSATDSLLSVIIAELVRKRFTEGLTADEDAMLETYFAEVGYPNITDLIE